MQRLWVQSLEPKQASQNQSENDLETGKSVKTAVADDKAGTRAPTMIADLSCVTGK